jgi:putative hydrolase of the HAD superfamily
MFDPQSIRAVFFDADDTLFEIRGSVGARYALHLKAHGFPITAEQLDEHVPESWKEIVSLYENEDGNYRAYHDRDREIWQLFAQTLFSKVYTEELPPQLFEDIYNEFGHANSRQLIPHIVPLLETLSRHELILGVFTNNDKRIHQLIPALGLKSHFHHVFCASDIGYRKPSRHAFDGISERIGIPSHELLYIGDCPKNDVEGALNAGWNVIWFGRDAKKSHERAATITCFSELVQALS